eukprot:1144464-Pelagomonas_calceolata.AAC.6
MTNAGLVQHCICSMQIVSTSALQNHMQIELWVTRANTGFVGVNPNNLRPATENVAALMCVDPPKYDRYTQLLEWGFAWDFDWCVQYYAPWMKAVHDVGHLGEGCFMV